MQGLTIAIFRQKLNFFFRKIFSIFGGIEDYIFFGVSDFLILSEVFGLSVFFVFADFFCSLESEQFCGCPECTNLLSCAMIDYYNFFSGLFFHR